MGNLDMTGFIEKSAAERKQKAVAPVGSGALLGRNGSEALLGNTTRNDANAQ